MKLGIIVYSTDAETLWNAFRLGVFALAQGDSVKAFLLGRGVECEKHDTEPFNVRKQMHDYHHAGGVITSWPVAHV